MALLAFLRNYFSYSDAVQLINYAELIDIMFILCSLYTSYFIKYINCMITLAT
jgi:hypothetical protein